MEERTCPVCGRTTTGQYCPGCGNKVPSVQFPAQNPQQATHGQSVRGTMAAPPPQNSWNGYAPEPQRNNQKKKSKTPLVIILALVCVLAVGAAVCGIVLLNRTYTVRFDPNGGTIVSGSVTQNVKPGSDATPPEASRDGWIFKGWDGEYSNVEEDCTVKAIWAEEVSVTFDPGEGTITSGDATQVIESGTAPEAPGAEREGYTFDGWEPKVGAVTEDTLYTANWTPKEYTPEELYTMVTPSVIEIHVYDKNGEYFAQGSGFFIDAEGTAVTNYHVIEEAYSADAITSDECAHTVTKVIAWDKELDLAIIQCDISNSQPLTISQREITTGETVYTVGSSLGLTGTISDGIVSAASREVEGVECIQITAPISHGNSGGPLLNRFGEAIGINSMTLNEGQNLNFAINIHLIESLDRSAPKTMEEFYNETAPQAGESDEEGGEWVYSDADESEEEPNDMPVLADPIENSEWIAGYCDEEDIDFFSFTLTEDTTVTTCLISYYEIDTYLMISGIVDGDLNVLASMDLQEDDDGELLTTTIDLPAGTYYVVVGLDEDYPFDTGAYYELSVLW